MPVVRCTDDYRVNVLPLQDLLIVLGGEDVAAVLLLHVLQSTVVTVAGSDNLR